MRLLQLNKNKMDRFLLNETKAKFRNILCIYSFAWIILSGIIFSAFYLSGKSFIWKEDGMHTYIPSLAYSAHYIRTFVNELFHGNINVLLYDFNYGMGMDTYNLILDMFVSPLKLIAVFFPMSKVETAYTIITLLRYYLCGVTFLCFCRHMGCKKWNSLTGAIIYCFCGYALNIGMKHPQFLIPMILLPLLCMYLDKSIKCNKFSLKLALVVAFSMANSYYFTFMNTIIIFLYGIIRFFNLYRAERRKYFVQVFFKSVAAYLLGIGLAAFAYLPLIYDFLNSQRTGSVIATDNMFFYSLTYYKKVMAYMVGPFKSCGAWTILGLSTVVLLTVVYIFIQRKETYKSLKIATVIGIIMLLIPAVGFVLSGFNSISNRWCFAIAFLMAFVVAVAVDGLEHLRDRDIRILVVVAVVYGCYVIMEDSIRNTTSLTAAVLLFIGVLLLMLCKMYPLKRKQFGFAVFLFACLTVILNAKYLYTISNYTNINTVAGRALSDVKDTPLRLLSKVEDDSFYRAERKGGNQASANASIVLRYNGVAQFNNVNSTEFLDYMSGLNIAGVKDIVLNYNLDGRTALDALAGVKYFGTTIEDVTSIPYGFSLVAKDKKYALYENKYALPIGYTYDSYITEDEYNSLTDLEKQQAMLQSAVLQYSEEKIKHNKLEDLQIDNKKLEITNIQLKNVVMSKNEIKVIKNGGTITFTVDAIADEETYIRLSEFSSVNPKYSARIYISNGNMQKSSYLQGSNTIYQSSRKDLLFNMGCSLKGTTTFTITFKKAGKFTYRGLEAWSQSMERYEEQINALQHESLKDITLNTNKVSGTITLRGERTLCFSIPYSTGWKAYVDGEVKELQVVNGMYMGLVLPAGEHQISLVYRTPGLRVGIVITVLSLMIGVFVFSTRKIRGRNVKSC